MHAALLIVRGPEFGEVFVEDLVAVLLTFLLARVFAEGTLMRADLEGTV